MQIIGIKRDKDLYHVASLSSRGGEIHIHFIETVLVSELNKKIDLRLHCLVGGLESSLVLLRSFSSPIKKRSLLKKTLPFKTKELLPFDVKRSVNKTVVESVKDGFFVSIFAVAQKSSVTECLDRYEGLDLDVLSLEPVALYRFALFLEEREKAFLTLHFDYDKITFQVIEQRRLIRYVTIDIGALAIKEALEQGGFCLARGEKISLSDCLSKGASKTIEILQQKIDRALCFLLQNDVRHGVNKILFTGLCETYPIEEIFFLTREKHFKPIVISNKQGFHVSTILSHAIPIGLSLDVIHDDAKSCQFLVRDFFPEHHKTYFLKKLKKHAFICFGLILCCSLLFFSKVGQGVKRNNAQLDALFEEFGMVYPPLLGGLGEDSTSAKIDFANRTLSKYGFEKTAFMPIPKVRDLFLYLKELKAFKALSTLEGFSITKVNYQMVERPTLQKPSNPYRIQVALQFACSNHERATALYEEIRRDKKHIDLKKEVTWTGRKHKYEISFFFKG